ncbi:MAG: NAD(P)/FAD-dependent oxidoreductase [Chloroflexota bacterium]|nr:NAD(P)/FAD-dependent oxidoreductase [Chloroflexota bacterium]
MTRRFVIVGGGVGGTIVANLLARRLSQDEAEVTLIDSVGAHVYMPAWLYIPFSDEPVTRSHYERPESSLLNRHVQLVIGEVTRVDPVHQELTVRRAARNGETTTAAYPYDELVLATGARLAPQDLTGMVESAGAYHEFYSAAGAVALQQALQEFQGGRIVVAVGGIPYRCPPAPLEFTFLLDEWLRKKHLRQRTEIEYLFPLPRVFPIEPVADVAAPLLEERGVKTRLFFNADELDGEHHIIRSLEGEDVPYDLLVLIPPHRGARLVEASELGDPQGWLETDRATLALTRFPHIYAIGDATNLPVSKSGSAAHFEARALAARLVALTRGEEPDPKHADYDGEVMCFLETGENHATQLVFNYNHPPQPPRPSLLYHMEKQLFNKAYWHIVPQGLV